MEKCYIMNINILPHNDCKVMPHMKVVISHANLWFSPVNCLASWLLNILDKYFLTWIYLASFYTVITAIKKATTLHH